MEEVKLNDNHLVDLLKNGAVGILPTDTVYGLVCLASDKSATQKLYALKSREHKPGTVIAADIDQLVNLGLKYRYLKAVSQFWPGPVSVIIASGPELDYLHQGLNGIAVRLPSNKSLQDLLKQTGPLLTTSANLPGEETAVNITEAKSHFMDKIDFLVDGGDLSNNEPSTIIRLIDDAIEVIRQGAVKIREDQ